MKFHGTSWISLAFISERTFALLGNVPVVIASPRNGTMDSARGFREVRGLLSSRDVLTDKCAFVLH